ncbi:hypothetical protein E1301_Tti023232 [Triplophysa tibetana]|uniref:Uncharacterized protein n=1 Tax=Triplophysa tibetana TaxID=1572043 RepID=A0A5A9MXH7_9TELE|nr:hypothetical protein E1301_Tti023232 [Triplophysa tibetana]
MALPKRRLVADICDSSIIAYTLIIVTNTLRRTYVLHTHVYMHVNTSRVLHTHVYTHVDTHVSLMCATAADVETTLDVAASPRLILLALHFIRHNEDILH